MSLAEGDRRAATATVLRLTGLGAILGAALAAALVIASPLQPGKSPHSHHYPQRNRHGFRPVVRLAASRATAAASPVATTARTASAVAVASDKVRTAGTL